MLQRKESASEQRNPASVAAVAAPPQGPEEEEETIAAVAESDFRISINERPIKIIRLKERKCDLRALIDTGSPVSFIREEV